MPRPTEPGWYWETPDSAPMVCELSFDPDDDPPEGYFWWAGDEVGCSLKRCPGTFLGPLVPPERPKNA